MEEVYCGIEPVLSAETGYLEMKQELEFSHLTRMRGVLGNPFLLSKETGKWGEPVITALWTPSLRHVCREVKAQAGAGTNARKES